MNVTERARHTIEEHNLLEAGERLVVGVSGGPDSICLLGVLLELSGEYRLQLHVAHLNHMTRGPDSDADADFVRRLAEEWGLPHTIGSHDVPGMAREKGIALEEACRQARYLFLSSVAAEAGARKIAVGHNADDQTETVIMHWLRGSGLSGLRGMLPATPLSDYRLVGRLPVDLTLIRPLLDVPRAEIEAYCAGIGQEPRFDLSNLDTTFFRNRLRHELIPYLAEYNPNVSEVVRRSAKVFAADYDVLREVVSDAWNRAVRDETPRAVVFGLPEWGALSLGLKRSLVREAIHRLRRGLRNIDFVHVEKAIEVLEKGQAGMQATLPQSLMLTVWYDSFVIADEGDPALPPWRPWLPEGWQARIAVPGDTSIPPGDWRLRADLVEPGPGLRPDLQGPLVALLDADSTGGAPLYLRTRRAGDRFAPLGMGGSTKKLNEFLVNERVPQQWRDYLPIVAAGERAERIVWVCSLRPDESARVTEKTTRVLRLEFVNETPPHI